MIHNLIYTPKKIIVFNLIKYNFFLIRFEKIYINIKLVGVCETTHTTHDSENIVVSGVYSDFA